MRGVGIMGGERGELGQHLDMGPFERLGPHTLHRGSCTATQRFTEDRLPSVEPVVADNPRGLSA